MRQRASDVLGSIFVEKLLADRLEGALAGWLEPYLSGKLPAKLGNGSIESRLVALLGKHVKSPALALGAGTGELAAALGVDQALERDQWRVDLARAAFPEVDFRCGDATAISDRYQCIVALGQAGAGNGAFRWREFLPMIAERLLPEGKLVLVDGVAYQDDAVSQLAALDFEIHDIAPFPEAGLMALVASPGEPE